jgi:hypothetical protein
MNKVYAGKIWTKDIDNIRKNCQIFECAWAQTALKELAVKNYVEIINDYKFLAEQGEANSMYDLNRLKNGEN